MAGMPEPPAEEPAAEEVPAPPEKTPAEYKVIARLSYKELDRIEGEPRARLLEAYLAFVSAVRQGSAEIEDLGDCLFEIYTEVKKR
jgi:hypothetical protein